jgi:hypothetical protein
MHDSSYLVSVRIKEIHMLILVIQQTLMCSVFCSDLLILPVLLVVQKVGNNTIARVFNLFAQFADFVIKSPLEGL